MANFLLVSVSAVIIGLAAAEPDYCKRGIKVAEAYQHCFEEAHYEHKFAPLYQHHDIYDGCMLEAYANHTCRVVKPKALSCFRANITNCRRRERLLEIADKSGGACYGDSINREFKEHVLNLLEPVRGDSECFQLGDRAYECYSAAGMEMGRDNPNLNLLTVRQFIPVANRFFNSIYNCYIKIYKSNRRKCENWQIPLLFEIQATALPSLFGMSFTPAQMDRMELARGCPNHHRSGLQPVQRTCYYQPNGEDGDKNNDKDNNESPLSTFSQLQTDYTSTPFLGQHRVAASTEPPFLKKLRAELSSG